MLTINGPWIYLYGIIKLKFFQLFSIAILGLFSTEVHWMSGACFHCVVYSFSSAGFPCGDTSSSHPDSTWRVLHATQISACFTLWITSFISGRSAKLLTNREPVITVNTKARSRSFWLHDAPRPPSLTPSVHNSYRFLTVIKLKI